jgi:hypothetical protein
MGGERAALVPLLIVRDPGPVGNMGKVSRLKKMGERAELAGDTGSKALPLGA